MIQLLLIFMLAVSAMGGTISAADNAVPGDALYGLDRAMERVSLTRASDTEQAELREKLINERLDEAARLLLDGDDPTGTPDPSETPTETSEPSEPTATFTPTPTETPDPSVTPEPSPTPTETPDPSETPEPSATPTETFTPTATPPTTETPTPTATVDPLLTPTPTATGDPAVYSCTGANPHPRASDLAEYYQVPYETIMTWFCQGHFGFGEIMHALEASLQTELTPEEILAKRAGEGWGQIWKELGLKGKPAKNADVPLDPTAIPPTQDPVETSEPVDPSKQNGKPENPGNQDQGKPDNPGNGNGNGNGNKDQDKGKPDNPGKSREKGNPGKPPKVK